MRDAKKVRKNIKSKISIVMNRANNKHFFELWDLAQTIQERFPMARPKEQAELYAMEEQLYREGGFYADYTYQEALTAYREYREALDAV